jgi:hypothetical protein
MSPSTRTMTYYLDGRLYEWVIGVSMASLGFSMLLFPRMLEGSIMTILAAMFNSYMVGTIFFALGLLRMAALIANGKSMEVGPRIRSVVATACSALWTMFTLSMIKVSIDQHFPSPMIYFFGPFTLAEVYISYRAVLDVRTGR